MLQFSQTWHSRGHQAPLRPPTTLATFNFPMLVLSVWISHCVITLVVPVSLMSKRHESQVDGINGVESRTQHNRNDDSNCTLPIQEIVDKKANINYMVVVTQPRQRPKIYCQPVETKPRNTTIPFNHLEWCFSPSVSMKSLPMHVSESLQLLSNVLLLTLFRLSASTLGLDQSNTRLCHGLWPHMKVMLAEVNVSHHLYLSEVWLLTRVLSSRCLCYTKLSFCTLLYLYQHLFIFAGCPAEKIWLLCIYIQTIQAIV